MSKVLSKEVVQVSQTELVDLLKEVKGPTPATIIATSVLKMKKTDNPYYNDVMKTQESNLFINFNYANSVNKRLVKEGKEADFVPKERRWGKRISGTPLVEHKENFYLEVGFLTKNKPKVSYTYKNEEIDKTKFEEFLSASSKTSRQGLEAEVVMRDFKIESIDEIRFGGKIYKIK